MVKIVFFDKNRCIVDFENASLIFAPRIMYEILKYFHTPANINEIVKAGEETIKDVAKFYGEAAVELHDYRIFLKHFLEKFFISPTDSQLTEAYNMLLEARTKQMKPAPGAAETLDAIRAKGIQTAILADSFYERVVYQLDKLGLLKHFNYIVTCDLVHKTKAQPGMYTDALTITKTNPSEAVMVSADDEDIRLAKQAGMKTVRLVKSGVEVKPISNYRIKELRELLNLPVFD
jgi:HAD superfamily hydrolase (TIGR01509 family)